MSANPYFRDSKQVSETDARGGYYVYRGWREEGWEPTYEQAKAAFADRGRPPLREHTFEHYADLYDHGQVAYVPIDRWLYVVKPGLAQEAV